MKFTKSSRSGHDFAIFIDYAIIVPRKYRTISPISPSPLQQHTQQRTPAPCRGPLSQLGKGIHKTFKREDMILQKFSGILTSYPGSNEQYLPFLPLLYNNTHSRRPRPRAGAFCRNLKEKFTERSKRRHDSAKILRYPNIVLRKCKRYLPFLPLLYNNTHSREPRPRAGAFCVHRKEKFTKRSRRRHDSAKILGYHNTVPRK